MSTNVFSHRDIKRSWHLVDAKNKTLGRISAEIARLIMGKNKPSFVPYMDNGDHVVVINAKDIKVTGQKEQQKVYFRHSMYPGGAKSETLAALRKRKPEDIITHAVKGMVPKTKLGKSMIKKLHVYAGKDHEYTQQIKGETQDGN
jgi:large subunit ribosomal protein L13